MRISQKQSWTYKCGVHPNVVLLFALIVLEKKKAFETTLRNSQNIILFYHLHRDFRRINETLFKSHFRLDKKRCYVITKSSSAFDFRFDC